MSLPTFCDACKARVEWHVAVSGKSMPIDPDPHAEGRFFFGLGLKLTSGAPGRRRRMYRCHWDTCAKGTEASKRGLKGERPDDECGRRWDCDRTDEHRHCFVCGATDHFAGDDCPES